MWIEDFRTSRGLERDEFARLIRVLGARSRPGRPIGCSEGLIYMLERMRGAVTHPTIANLIAGACGATDEQRDMIVAEKHRGKWRGDGVPRLRMAYAPRKAAQAEMKPKDVPNGKDVVMIDAAGDVLRKYSSMQQAADDCGLCVNVVFDRAHRRVRREFERLGRSFRLAGEWEKMTTDERLADLAWVAANGGRL